MSNITVTGCPLAIPRMITNEDLEVGRDCENGIGFFKGFCFEFNITIFTVNLLTVQISC